MRAGKLDKVITIEAYATGTPDELGVSTPGWSEWATVRADLLQSSTEEYLRGYGEGAETTVIFRTRWLDGVTTAHRVTYAGAFYNIKETKEIGRRVGLELRCEVVRT